MKQIELLANALEYMEDHLDKDITTLDIAGNCYCSRSTLEKLFRYINHMTVHDYLTPRLLCPLETGDDYMKQRKNVDISELYDLFSSRRDCCFVCCDIKNLMEINKISRKAGDLVILEAIHRMNSAAGPEDIVFRIGGDEFALLTDSPDRSYAESIVRKLQSDNGRSIHYEDQEIPLFLHTGIVKLENKTVRYNELFTGLHSAIRDCKK